MDFWNALGLFLTFVGTAIACYQAYKAKCYRDEIQSDRHKLVLIELVPIAKRSREECKKITTPVSKPMRGVDPQKVIDAIKRLTEKLTEFQLRLGNDYELNCSANKINMLVSEYTSETNMDKRHAVADQIYQELNSVIRMLTSKIDLSV